MKASGYLPYSDVKSIGAAGFYWGINATFRYIISHYGITEWKRYLEDLARSYFQKCNRMWAAGGLPAVAEYWRQFFASEPDAVVEVAELGDRVEISVKQCPAIAHLRKEGCDITPEYCRHCQILGRARAEESGLQMRLQGGNGRCVHTYAAPSAALPPQAHYTIEEVR